MCGIIFSYRQATFALFTSQETLFYFFMITSGRDLHNSEIGLEYEAIEDCVLLIGRHEVSILYRCVPLPMGADYFSVFGGNIACTLRA